ncbi:MAG: DUF192 domain-containing protein [Candidatus Omnitrophica bacterium]|nr:DUF192 domain-containing protein [Candidatus Omnitrophota bacterium]MCB9747553.1 DUF192 domain-containing protein [Candidatus Omnitrophota bacterium]
MISALVSGCNEEEISKKNQVCFNTLCVNVEVADSNEERMKGLQFRRELGKKEGMLFIFPYSSQHDFWMKDTYISLDMIWMDYTRTIIYIQKNVPPCKKDPCPSYGPDQNTNYVLEVNAGFTERNDISVGDRAKFILNY